MTRTPTLTIATDASVGHVRGVAAAGVAWVSAEGHYRVGTCRTRVPLVGELSAMHQALTSSHVAGHFRKYRTAGRVVLLSDCRPAIDALTTVLTTATIPTAAGIRGNQKIARLLHLIATELRRRPVELVWVKGHDGHPLNEVADRLAVQARRCIQSGGQLRQIGVLTDRIAAEARLSLAS